VIDRYNRQSNLISRALNVRKCEILVYFLLFPSNSLRLASLVYTNMKPVVVTNQADYLSVTIEPNVYDQLVRNRTTDEKGR
jgi:hypothetical protein